jgi:hypothetical protein
VIQALCAVGLLALGAIGYVYTVLPLYSTAVLEEEASHLKLDNQHLKRDNDELGLQKSQIEKELTDYRLTATLYVTDQFLTKVESTAGAYRCSPTVLDRGAENVVPPSPMTGAKLIETNLNNREFNLLPETERRDLVKIITDFVAAFSPREDFTAALEIQHVASFTGPNAGLPKPWPDPFKFCEEERRSSERAFQSFGRGLTALQTRLLSTPHNPIVFSACRELGLLPRCANSGSPLGR